MAYINEMDLALTHGLVAGGDGGGVVEHQDLSLKLPGGLGGQLRRDHHHALPYR